MLTSDFDFHLPETLIATRPASPRDSARMLVVGETFQDKTVRDLPDYLRAGDVLVLNNTRVIPARLYGRRGEAKIEILLHQRIAENTWRCFARPAKRLQVGDEVVFAESLCAGVLAKLPSGEVELRFDGDEGALYRHGQIPLPPYIEQQRAADEKDAVDYQTIYAEHEGSVAAPTAGLHFTPELFEALEAKGVHIAFVTLHVGAGTFLPVKAERIEDHVMHHEWYEVPAETQQMLRGAKGRVIAVGTTSLRTLEAAAESGQAQGSTDIFITPGYKFKAVDGLLTNFHLPRSTLFMLVSALAGTERMKAAYEHAIKNNYRFYSYGDACLIV